jgi:hypothetical protein
MRHRYRRHHQMLLEICEGHRSKLGLRIPQWSEMSETEQIRWTIKTLAEGYLYSESFWVQAKTLLHQAMAGSSPINIELAERMLHPQPGDLVYERSSYDAKGRGRFLLRREELITNECGKYKDTATYIECLDGSLKRWRNCEFIAVEWPNNYDLESALRRHDLC